MTAPTLTNDRMIAGRFKRWADARAKLAWIRARWAEGRTVLVCTQMRAIRLSAKHADTIRATRSGLYRLAGKRWECIDYCKLIAEATK